MQQCPDTTFILDHLCNPNVKDKEIDVWKKHLVQLAALENTYCKESGIITKADRESRATEAIQLLIKERT